MPGSNAELGESPKGPQLAWKVTAMLVERQPGGAEDKIVLVVPTMEFAASWLKGVAKNHTLCSHPTDLSCQLIRRWRELAEQFRTKQRTLEKMGVPRRKGEKAL